MKRNIVNIGQHRFLVEHYDADKDSNNIHYYSEFVMFRNFTIINNIVNDTDIFIIDKRYLDEYIKELKESDSNTGDSVVFPITSAKITSYSTSYQKFNTDYNINDNIAMYEGDEYGNAIYEIYEKKDNALISKKIKCDKLKIYHPLSKSSINAIIDISNYINGIHFHYLCKKLNDFPIKSETEIVVNNERYSEYFEVYFPNINDLFKINDDGSYSSLYKEDMDIVASTKNEKFINSILSNSSDLEQSENYNGEQIVPLNLLIQPFRIIEEYAAENTLNYDEDLSNDDKIFVKLFVKSKMSIENNYLTYPISVTFFMYDHIDTQLKKYNLDVEYQPITTLFTNKTKFELLSKIGFYNGIISIVTFFKYPNESYFYNLYHNDSTTTCVKEAYKYYNNIDEDIYNMFINQDVESQINAIDNISILTDEMKDHTIRITNKAYSSDDDILNAWKQIMKETIVKEYEEEFGTPVNFLGFKVEISSNNKFTNIIYDKNVRINFADIDDFSFNINGIFTAYQQFPEQLCARVIFYDKILGISIVSNPIIISNDWRNYLINSELIYRMKVMSKINYNKGNNDDMKIIELNNDNINFINNVKCIISKSENSNNVSINGNANQKIIFKPIFYKVKELQNIKLRRGITQNIGINLGNYMTKIETFKLTIEDTEYTEIGRNDVYVIFAIKAGELINESGYYNIINQDGEYISSGNWSIQN